MTTILPIFMAAILGGWAFLSLLGGERTRRAREVEAAADERNKEPKPAGVNSQHAALLGAATQSGPRPALSAAKPAANAARQPAR